MFKTFFGKEQLYCQLFVDRDSKLIQNLGIQLKYQRTVRKKTRVGQMSGNGQILLHLQLATVSIIELTCGSEGWQVAPYMFLHLPTFHSACPLFGSHCKILQVMQVAPQNLHFASRRSK